MIDAVLSYHLNPHTCGVAKFNLELARQLGVPCLALGVDRRGYLLRHDATHPLVSIKTSEIVSNWTLQWRNVLPRGRFDLLLHDRPVDANRTWADHVFYADELGCPSTLRGNASRGDLDVLIFGMAHKINGHSVYLLRLKELLDRAGCAFTVSVSTAVHEGSPWDGVFASTEANLRSVFGEHLRVLGYLADDGLAYELSRCSAVALFFEPAARANNTTIWAAMDAGAAVVTNLDGKSPPELVHCDTVFDLNQLTDWPMYALRMKVASQGQQAGKVRSWDNLVKVLRAA